MKRTELALTATGTWIGFGLMCLGMFMAILDIQVVATSLPTIQGALAISPEAMSWIQTDRRGHRHSADRLAHAYTFDALALHCRYRVLHLGIDRVCCKR